VPQTVGQCREVMRRALAPINSTRRKPATSRANVDRGDSLARKRIDGSRACPRVGIVLQRSVVEIAAQRSASSAHSGKNRGGRRSMRGRELDLEVAISDGVRRKT
jgi:hypothetical protein